MPTRPPARAADHAQAMLAGFNHYLTKPFNPQTLLTLLERIAVPRA
ncbi:MAG: hypothetical protein ACT4P4_09585 [Betaproteobacteria bacterium]